MKYLKIIIITVVFALNANSTIAQEELYKKYSGVKGVTRIYISEAMFSLFKGEKSIDLKLGKSDVIDIREIMGNLTGLYILSSDFLEFAGRIERDFDKLIKEKKYELLMEIEDNSDIVKMYITKEAKTIKNFFMKVKEKNGDITIMFFKGDIPESELAKIVNSAK